jgi:hypothetical protein
MTDIHTTGVAALAKEIDRLRTVIEAIRLITNDAEDDELTVALVYGIATEGLRGDRTTPTKQD